MKIRVNIDVAEAIRRGKVRPETMSIEIDDAFVGALTPRQREELISSRYLVGEAIRYTGGSVKGPAIVDGTLEEVGTWLSAAAEVTVQIQKAEDAWAEAIAVATYEQVVRRVHRVDIQLDKVRPEPPLPNAVLNWLNGKAVNAATARLVVLQGEADAENARMKAEEVIVAARLSADRAAESAAYRASVEAEAAALFVARTDFIATVEDTSVRERWAAKVLPLDELEELVSKGAFAPFKEIVQYCPMTDDDIEHEEGCEEAQPYFVSKKVEVLPAPVWTALKLVRELALKDADVKVRLHVGCCRTCEACTTRYAIRVEISRLGFDLHREYAI